MISDIALFLRSFFSKNEEEYPFQKIHEELSVIDIYRAWLKVRFEILDAVFGNYSRDEKFVPPDYWLQMDYVGVNRRLKGMTEEKILSSIPAYNFDRFCNLQVDHERMIAEYSQEAEKMMTYRAKVEELFVTKCKNVSDLPDHLVLDIKEYEKDIQKHLKKRSPILDEVASGGLQFTAAKSNKKSVYLFLRRHKNEWVNKKEIMSKCGLNYDDFRSIIAQLRSDIASQKLSKYEKIENDGEGKYKLTILASKT